MFRCCGIDVVFIKVLVSPVARPATNVTGRDVSFSGKFNMFVPKASRRCVQASSD